MASHLMKRAGCIVPRVVARASSSSTKAPATQTYPQDQLPQELKDIYYPTIGNRDLVGYGWNGQASYVDRMDFPFPAVRFGENTPELMKLREKEKGDWKKLTMEEKKNLYRASFCQTLVETYAPTGEWKNVLAIGFAGVIVTGWLLLWMKKYVYMDLPRTITEEWKERSTEHMVRQGQNPIEGISSMWDYEKNQWK